MNRSFTWKVVYACGIAALLFPLFLLGNPGSGEGKGGVLARMRSESQLSQANLGQIDLAGESMKFATLGLRGVAAAYLWLKSNEDRKTEDWDALAATLNQLKRLQPNYLGVWEFQAHNLSYNVSVEFDNYRHRYQWVKRGADFLIEGTQYNRGDPGLLYFLGWITGQKIGRADEHVEFREMFRKDKDWHDSLSQYIVGVDSAETHGPDDYPDNWLVGRLWYLESEKAARTGRALRKNPLVFHLGVPMSRINYADASEEEGHFEQAIMTAWRYASEDWRELADLSIPTLAGVIQLRMADELKEQVAKLEAELEELNPGIADRIREQRLLTLTDEQRALIETPAEQRAAWEQEQWVAYSVAQQKLVITRRDVAREAPSEVHARARRLATQLEEAEARMQRVQSYRGIANYDYWDARCAAEQTELTTTARRLLHDAAAKFDQADLEGAEADYDRAWDMWVEIFEKWPILTSIISSQDLRPAVSKYRDVLRQQNKPDISPDFKLAWLLSEQELTELLARQAETPGAAPAPVPTPGTPPMPAQTPDSPAPTPEAGKTLPPDEGDSTSESAASPDASSGDTGAKPLPPEEE